MFECSQFKFFSSIKGTVRKDNWGVEAEGGGGGPLFFPILEGGSDFTDPHEDAF